MGFDNFFGVFWLALGTYLLYSGATGKGQMFRSENIKKGKEALFKKRMRILSLILGPVMLGQGIVELLMADNAALITLSYVLWGMSMALIIVMVVVSVRLTDRSRPPAQGGQKKGAPRAAFFFDEEDEKAD